MREYTTKSLTFASDRTEALRGIGRLYETRAEDQHEGQCYRKDGYIPEYGVWKDQLVFQLLWFNNGTYCRYGSLPNMPSWSWAATSSAKIWPSEGTSIWASTREAEELPEHLSVTSSGHLQIRGHLSTIHSMPSHLKDEFTARKFKLGRLESVWGSISSGNFYLLRQDTNDR